MYKTFRFWPKVNRNISSESLRTDCNLTWFHVVKMASTVSYVKEESEWEEEY